MVKIIEFQKTYELLTNPFTGKLIKKDGPKHKDFIVKKWMNEAGKVTITEKAFKEHIEITKAKKEEDKPIKGRKSISRTIKNTLKDVTDPDELDLLKQLYLSDIEAQFNNLSLNLRIEQLKSK